MTTVQERASIVFAHLLYQRLRSELPFRTAREGEVPSTGLYDQYETEKTPLSRVITAALRLPEVKASATFTVRIVDGGEYGDGICFPEDTLLEVRAERAPGRLEGRRGATLSQVYLRVPVGANIVNVVETVFFTARRFFETTDTYDEYFLFVESDFDFY